MLVSMLVERVILNPFVPNSSRISLALSGWHTIVVREFGVNNWLIYFLPTETISSTVTLFTWRICCTFKSVMRLVPRKQVEMKFCNTTASILFSRSTNSNTSELLADSSKAESQVASGESCASWIKKNIFWIVYLSLLDFISTPMTRRMLTVIVLNCLNAAVTFVARYKVK